MSSGASALGKLVVVQAGSEPGGTRSARPDRGPAGPGRIGRLAGRTGSVRPAGPAAGCIPGAGITAVTVVPRPARELLGAER